jgi:formylglycine-generating enzyme
MFRKTSISALAALAALGNFSLATAQGRKVASGEKQVTNSIGMKLTLIPSGTFMMGCGESEEQLGGFLDQTQGDLYTRQDDIDYDVSLLADERPQHQVRFSKPFYLGTYHVTRGQFQQFVRDTRFKTDAERGNNSWGKEWIESRWHSSNESPPTKPGAVGWDPGKKTFGYNESFSWSKTGFAQSDEHPVVNVSWNDAVAFCKWLSGKEGKNYRLPTEAEWEYACRAGTKTRFSFGDEPESLAKAGNVADAMLKAKLFADDPRRPALKASDGYVFTAPVGRFRPNSFGLYDMHGNAWQWCADWHAKDYYEKCPKDDPNGPASGNKRVLRGGSWLSPPVCARSAHRLYEAPDYRDDHTGFRVARTL